MDKRGEQSMPRMRGVAGALMLAGGSVGFGLFAATASAQPAPGGPGGTVTGTAKAGPSTIATGTVGSAPTAVHARAADPAATAPGGGGGGNFSNNAVQVIAGNHTGTCSPIVAQQVNNSNNTAANNNGSANDSPAINVSNGQSSAPGNGRGTGDIGKNNTISQNVNVSCFNNSSPQTVTRTVVVPHTVTKTVVVPQTVVQQAPVAAPVTTTAHFTG